MNRTFSLLLVSATSAWALPSVGPDYQRPTVPVPAAYSAEAVKWTAASPSDQIPRGAWWTSFNDPVLNELERNAVAANQDLRAAAARVDEARALAGINRSQSWPQLALDASASREQTSRTTDIVFPDTLTTTYRAPVVLSWEIDLFGRVRRLREGAEADAAAAAALFEAARLSLTAEVAATYFNVRGADREWALLDETVALRRRALSVIDSRRRHGTAAEVDVARAQTELATAEADRAGSGNHRAALQHALAVLVGKPASEFTIVPTAGTIAAPTIPAGLPAQLVERRPDIAAAERRLMAANARIGVAKAAFFPAISLTGSAGYASGEMSDLFRADSRVWALAPGLYLPLFQGGRNRANLEHSRAAFDAAVATRKV